MQKLCHWTILERIGELEFRDKSTTIYACLAALLRYHAQAIKLEYLLSYCPIPINGANQEHLATICQRLQISAVTINLTNWLEEKNMTPLLIHNGQGYWFLLFPIRQTEYLLAMPGLIEPFRLLKKFDGIFGQQTQAFELKINQAVSRDETKLIPPKLWLLDWCSAYLAKHDKKKIASVATELKSTKLVTKSPSELTDLSVKGLLNSHGQICVLRPDLFGQFRQLNLQRGGIVFVDWTRVPEAISELLKIATNFSAKDQADYMDFSAKFFSDFLAIHPFVDANYRMATLLVTRILKPVGLNVDWSKIGRSEHYFWVNNAQRGNLQVLRQGLLDYYY